MNYSVESASDENRIGRFPLTEFFLMNLPADVYARTVWASGLKHQSEVIQREIEHNIPEWPFVFEHLKLHLNTPRLFREAIDENGRADILNLLVSVGYELGHPSLVDEYSSSIMKRLIDLHIFVPHTLDTKYRVVEQNIRSFLSSGALNHKRVNGEYNEDEYLSPFADFLSTIDMDDL